MLEWEWIGEGDSSDYNPGDPNDTPRLRATLFHESSDEPVENGSYCTWANTDATFVELTLLSKILFARLVVDDVPERAMQEWTWQTKPEGAVAA